MLNEEREYGLHSNIPLCCVEYFCSLTNAEIIQLNAERTECDKYKNYKNTQYVPCPECFEQLCAGLQEPAQLHFCTKECVEVLRAQGLSRIPAFMEKWF